MISFSVRGGVRMSPIGTWTTVWPIVPAPDDRWWWVWSSRWNENWQRKPKDSGKTCPSATLSTTNPTWPDMGSKPGGKPVTNRLSYGTALTTSNCQTIESKCSTPLITKPAVERDPEAVPHPPTNLTTRLSKGRHSWNLPSPRFFSA
jgi:hypothetical protein